MLACVVLQHDHVIRSHTGLGPQDVGSEVPVEAASMCGNSLEPFFVALFTARPDAMGDHGCDVNAGIHAGRAPKTLLAAL